MATVRYPLVRSVDGSLKQDAVLMLVPMALGCTQEQIGRQRDCSTSKVARWIRAIELAYGLPILTVMVKMLNAGELPVTKLKVLYDDDFGARYETALTALSIKANHLTADERQFLVDTFEHYPKGTENWTAESCPGIFLGILAKAGLDAPRNNLAGMYALILAANAQLGHITADELPNNLTVQTAVKIGEFTIIIRGPLGATFDHRVTATMPAAPDDVVPAE